jgi:3'-phosphoadenosine 5'-phosphosulfate sulfotransferase (PAPS reductase)/FAD synthetase
MLRGISLGAGVQSTAMIMMADAGEIGPKPDFAIFSDTGWEPKRVYRHLDWIERNVSIPIYRVSAGNIRDDILRGAQGERWASIPAFTKKGMIRRQCTKEYKIVPIRRKARELAGLTGKRSPKEPVVEQWIGISLDEAIRMRTSRELWQVNRYPLIEKRMTRGDCLEWLKAKAHPEPPKSSCIGCPFHSNAQWREIRDNDAEAWADAVHVDQAIRTGFKGMKHELFLHRSGVPLDQVDLTTLEDHGQLNLFLNECEGMCGV